MTAEDDQRLTDWAAYSAAQLALGICPDSGLRQHDCHLGPCDCFEPQGCAWCQPVDLHPAPSVEMACYRAARRAWAAALLAVAALVALRFAEARR